MVRQFTIVFFSYQDTRLKAKVHKMEMPTHKLATSDNISAKSNILTYLWILLAQLIKILVADLFSGVNIEH